MTLTPLGLLATFALGSIAVASADRAPHIIFILADDLGWNDVSFHGSGDSSTPHIDALAASGIALDSYYVNPVCSPTRGSLMSGRSVIHTGIFTPFGEGEDVSGLNTSYSILPQVLKSNFNYSSYHVGKWHLGMHSPQFLPSARGFQRSFGYYTGIMDYWGYYDDETYGVKGHSLHLGGTDFGLTPGYDETITTANGTYSTLLFADKAKEWIADHAEFRADQPMFLYVAMQGIHSANNKYIQAPKAYIDRFDVVSPEDTCPQYSADCTAAAKRKSVVAAVNVVDDAVGDIVESLKRYGLYNDSLIVFSTDNGGPTNGEDANMANNAPLRGGKANYFEGGLRGVGLIHGAGLQRTGYHYKGLHHVSDWYPTFVSAAASLSGKSLDELSYGDQPPFLNGDGLDNWAALSSGEDVKSARSELIHITQAAGLDYGAHALRVGDLKLAYNQGGGKNEDLWYPQPGGAVRPFKPTIDCGGDPPSGKPESCTPTSPCLYNISSDPCEYTNIAAQNPEVVKALTAKLAEYATHTVYPFTDYSAGRDPCGNPSLLGDAWKPFMTDEAALAYYPLNYTVPPVRQPMLAHCAPPTPPAV